MIEIIEVLTKRQLKEFIKFPDHLYRGNKYRVPQLHIFEKTTLSREKNPAFDFCEARYWLAYKNGLLVGRIAGIINHKANELWNDKAARFGWIDFVDDAEVSAALLKTVEDWAVSKGLKKLQGPLGFTDMDMEGMLVEGFEELSTQIAIYNYPYYPVHMEKFGYSKDVDWVQFEIQVPEKIPEKVQRVADVIKQKYGLRESQFKSSREILPYASKMFKTYNEAFRHLYGFTPLTDRQIKFYIDQYFSMIDPKYVKFIIDGNDDVVGFGFCFLSLSKALIKAKGRLFPFGFIPVLWSMKHNDTVDLIMQGVKDEYHAKGVPAIFYASIMQVCIDNGITKAIASSVLEQNKESMLLFTNGYEKRMHMRRRSYKKILSA
ncbi:MAG TPA: N-acetyltransferase [Bacteroidales bacterium]|nr:N-acetyltransferase [Bacteroidales bacterium]